MLVKSSSQEGRARIRWVLYWLSSAAETLELLREEDFPWKSMFRLTVLVSCISGSRSSHPPRRNKGSITSISQRNFPLNPILFLNRILYQQKPLHFKKTTRMLNNMENLYLSCFVVASAICNINRFVLQELGIYLSKWKITQRIIPSIICYSIYR